MRLPCGTVLLMSCTWILVCQGFGNKISPSVKTHEIISFTNGQWFDGQSFKPMTGCIVEEKLVFRLLDIWTRATAKAIFPARKIGELKEGGEASFLVSRGNPIDDFAAIRDIVLEVKQGAVLTPRDRNNIKKDG